MKLHMLLPISIAVSLASFALLKIRVKPVVELERKDRFVSVKLRVIGDMLTEYLREKQNIDRRLESEKSALESLQKAMTELNTDAEKSELEMCVNTKKLTTDEVGSLQEQAKTFQAESTKERTAWGAEIATLKEKLNAPSPICNYLKPGSSANDFCPDKKEEPKPEPPKPQEEKKDPPNAEEKKDEPSKTEEGKADAPNPDAPNPDAPNPDAPKPNAPNPDAAKPKEPNPDAAKPNAPNPDVAKPEAPNPNAPNPNEPNPDAPNPDAAKPKEPK